MTVSKHVNVILFLIFLSFCNSGKHSRIKQVVTDINQEPVDVRFILKKTVHIPDLIEDSGFLFLNKEYIFLQGRFLPETDQFKIIQYDSELKKKNEFNFKFGQGPGELSDGTMFRAYGENFVTFDNVSARGTIYDKNFNLKEIFRVPRNFAVTLTDDGQKWLLTTQCMEKNNRRLWGYNLNTGDFPKEKIKKIFTIGPYLFRDKNYKFIIGSRPQFRYFVKSDKIYFVNLNEYIISIINFNGELLKQVKLNYERNKVTVEDKKRFFKETKLDRNRFTLFDYVIPGSTVIPLSKGFIVLRRNNYFRRTQDDGPIAGDYFDFELNSRGTVKCPYFTRVNSLDTAFYRLCTGYMGGYLYLITNKDDDHFIQKWKIEESKI
jgi:hypothetical protein